MSIKVFVIILFVFLNKYQSVVSIADPIPEEDEPVKKYCDKCTLSGVCPFVDQNQCTLAGGVYKAYDPYEPNCRCCAICDRSAQKYCTKCMATLCLNVDQDQCKSSGGLYTAPNPYEPNCSCCATCAHRARPIDHPIDPAPTPPPIS